MSLSTSSSRGADGSLSVEAVVDAPARAVPGTNGHARVGPPPPDLLPPRRRWSRTIVFALVVALVATGVGIAVRQALLAPPERGILTASGRIEGRTTTITPKSDSRVVRIRVDEGQSIAAGDVLLVLDDEAQRERIRAATENVRSVRERLRASDTELAAASVEAPLLIQHAEAALDEARAGRTRARDTVAQMTRDAERADTLVARDLISRQDAELARLRASVESAGLSEAEARVARAGRQLAVARLALARLEARRAERDGLARQAVQAEAALAEQRSYLTDFTVRSPIDATVLTRNVELGERVLPGTTLYTLVDMNRLYLKIYVREPDIGKIALGQEARVRVDAFAGRSFPATVTKVGQQAEFTPKNVETREERVKLVFPVELSLAENPGRVLKPGMPAEADVRTAPGAAWPRGE